MPRNKEELNPQKTDFTEALIENAGDLSIDAKTCEILAAGIKADKQKYKSMATAPFAPASI